MGFVAVLRLAGRCWMVIEGMQVWRSEGEGQEEGTSVWFGCRG
jgi:hypothetical protein